MFGVSPAYFISAFTDRFGPQEVAAGLGDIRALGYTGYQLEVYHPETLSEWTKDGTRLVADTGRELGMRPTQFVGHFLLHGFSTPQAITGTFGVAETEQVVRMLAEVPECDVITVPLPPFAGGAEYSAERGSPYAALFTACVTKLRRMLEIVEDGGKRMALEIVPGAIVSGSDGYLRLREAVGSSLGYNLDTGHAWAQKEPVAFLPRKLAGCVFGTHLCDNMAGENESWRPGQGSVPWSATIAALLRSGYEGSLDLEIKCEPGDVAAEYSEGLRYLQKLAEETDGDGENARE